MGEPSVQALVVSDIAEMLSVVAGTEVTPVFGGFRIRGTEAHYIDVLRQLVNWRVVETFKDIPSEYGRYWCFAGAGLSTLILTVQAVADWDCADDTEPAGWRRNGQTGELRRVPWNT